MKCLGIRQQCDTETGYCHADGTYGSGCLVSGRHKEENTQGMINVIRHPKIHIISHPGDGSKSVILQGLYYFTWITDCYRIGWDVTSDHRSSSNGHVVADGDTR